MLNLQHAKTFLTVLDENGVRAAARRLKLSPSTVVDHIRQLEQHLAAPLIVRGRGAAQATAQGLSFVPLARALVRTAESASDVVRGTLLRIAASTNIGTYVLPAPLASFQSAETTSVDVWIGDNPAVAQRIETGTADLAVMEWWDGRPGFEAVVWRQEPLVLIVAPGHAWTKRRSISAEELRAERLLGGEPGTGTGRLLREQLGEVFDDLQTVGGFGGTEAVKRAVRAGLGVSIVLAASVADEIAAGVLAAVPIRGVTLSKGAYIVVPSSLPATAAASRFRRHMFGQSLH